MSAEGLQPIIQSYIAAQQGQAEQQRLDLMRQNMQDSHDLAQEQLKQAKEFHKNALDQSYLANKVALTQHLNQAMGTPQGALGLAMQPGQDPNLYQLFSQQGGPGSGGDISYGNPPTQQFNQPSSSGGPQGMPGLSTQPVVSAPQLNLGINQPFNYRPGGPGSLEDRLTGGEGLTVDPNYRQRAREQALSEGDIAAQVQGGIEGAKAQAKMPEVIAQNKARLEEARITAETTANIAARSREQIAREHNQELEKIEGMKEGAKTSAYPKERLQDMAGGYEPVPDTPSEYNKAATEAYKNGIHLPTRDADKDLRQMAGLDSMLGDVKFFAQNHSLGSNPIMAKSAQDSVNSRLGGAVTEFNNSKRFNQTEMAASMAGLGADMWKNSGQNLSNYEDHRRQLQAKIDALTSNMSRDERIKYLKQLGYNNLREYRVKKSNGDIAYLNSSQFDRLKAQVPNAHEED